MQDYARGLESMKEAEMWMKYSTLSETKSITFKKEISKNIEFLAEKVCVSVRGLYRVKHRGLDFRADCTKFILSVFLHF